MKFYIAARFADKDLVKRLNARVIEEGHQLSGDWTDHKQVKPYSKEPKRSEEYAIEDLTGAIEADVFVLISNQQPGAGSSTELGAALAMHVKFGKPLVYVVGDYPENNLFNYHSAIKRVKTIDDVFDDL